MAEIGSKPILWQIMKIYSAHWINDFIVCLDTGDETMTGGRLKEVARLLDNEPFCFSDSLSDVDISELIAFHRQDRGLATLTAVQPPGRAASARSTSRTRRSPDFEESPKARDERQSIGRC